jgi:peptidoglycan/LPS O-acetylase OafA/YrhL
MSLLAPPAPASIESTAPRPASQPRLEGLDGFRALAALFVVLHHAWLIVWPVGYRKYPTGLTHTLTGWLGYGHFAVVAFIAISGFCLGLPLATRGRNGWKGMWHFYGRRARRILPPYYASIAFTLLLIAVAVGDKLGTHWDSAVPVDYSKLWIHLLLVNNIALLPQINGVYWSIAVEWQIYLVFPILAWIWLRTGPYAAALVGTVAGTWIGIKTTGTPLVLVSGQLLAVFCFGFLGAHLYANFGPRLKPKMLLFAASVLLFAIVVFCARMSLGQIVPRFYWLDLPVGVCAVLLILAAVRAENPWHAFLEGPRLRKLGVFSYSLYLMHMPLLQVAWLLLVAPFGLTELPAFLIVAFAGTALSIGVSYGFFLLVESRFLNSAQPKLTGVKS